MSRICVEVDLGDFRTGEIINELRRRRSLTRDDLIDLSPKEIVRMLEEFGCPESIILQLLDWASEPVPTLYKLVAWKESCGVT